MLVCVYMCMYVSMNVYIYVCVYVCMYLFKCEGVKMCTHLMYVNLGMYLLMREFIRF